MEKINLFAEAWDRLKAHITKLRQTKREEISEALPESPEISHKEGGLNAIIDIACCMHMLEEKIKFDCDPEHAPAVRAMGYSNVICRTQMALQNNMRYYGKMLDDARRDSGGRVSVNVIQWEAKLEATAKFIELFDKINKEEAKWTG